MDSQAGHLLIKNIQQRNTQVHIEEHLVAMSSVKIRIEAAAATSNDFELTLFEEDGSATSVPLLARQLTFDIGNGPQGPKDIIERASRADASARQNAAFQKISEVLFEWLIPPGPVRNRWDELCKAQRPSVTIEVRDSLLAQLPWEMASSQAPRIRISAAGAVQRLEEIEERPTLCSSWPLRILFVTGCSAADEKQLGVDQERDKIWRAFLPFGRSVVLQHLERPTNRKLGELVSEDHPHIFHFAGHGGLQAQTDSPGLLFQNETAPWIWDTENIAADLLSWNWTPTFVFLNACRSAVDPLAYWSVQRTFLAAGAKSVVGMQADIGGDLAGPFAAKLYEECVAGRSVQQAAFEGRKGLSADAKWIPVLTTTKSDLKVHQPTSPPANLPFEQCGEFEQAKFFANCHEERRKFTYWLNPPITPRQSQHKNIALLEGPPKSGKSHLLKWCMESWAMAGAQVRYLELHSGSAKTFLSVLRHIRDGDSDKTYKMELLHSPLPEKHFRKFNWELKNFIATGQPGEWDEVQYGNVNVGDAGDTLTTKGERRIESLICASFLESLNKVAAQAQLVLVFDKLTGPRDECLIHKSEFEHLVFHLFQPIARDQASRIKLVFALNHGQRVEFGLNTLPANSVLPWDLSTNFTNDQLASLAAEMFWFREEEKVKLLAASLLGFKADKNAPVGLAILKGVFDAIHQSPELAGVSRMR